MLSLKYNYQTPLVKLTNLATEISWQGQLWAKCEFQNPTGSFKDRGSFVEIKQALKLKKSGVVCASTGNMAASLSSFAAKNKLNCVVFVPKNTPKTKLKQALFFKAKVKKIKGSYDDCASQAKTFAQKNNYLLCGDYELRRLGQTTIGIELGQAKAKFSAFIAPVGNGTLGCAICQGFAIYGQFPKFIGIQGKGADPITTAFKTKNKIKPIKFPKTTASAMCVGNPLDGKMTLDWIKKTKGMLESVEDSQIISAQKLLGKTEGIFVEAASAASLAGLIKFKNKLSNKLNIVLILTGSGLKES
jgi:threonine synthase